MNSELSLGSVAFLVFAMYFYLAVMGCVEPMKDQPQEFGSTAPGQVSHDRIFTQHRSEKGRDMGGVAQRPGLSIHWAGSDRQDSSVRPVDVARVMVDRLEAEQQTDLGSDKNARAIVLMLQAIDALTGDDQTIDGVPVIK